MHLGEHERRDDVDVEDVVHHARPDGRQPRQVGRADVVDQAAQAEGGGQGLEERYTLFQGDQLVRFP